MKADPNVLASLHGKTLRCLNVANSMDLIYNTWKNVDHSIDCSILMNFILSNAGPSGKAVRQYFPYVSSESDLQRYKAITLHKHPSNDTRASSSLSNVPSDSNRMKVNSRHQNTLKTSSLDRLIQKLRMTELL